MTNYTDEHFEVLDDYIADQSDDHSNLFVEVWALIPPRKQIEIIQEIENKYGITAEELIAHKAELENLDDEFLPFEDED